jgi:LacI family transcriptional regulator
MIMESRMRPQGLLRQLDGKKEPTLSPHRSKWKHDAQSTVVNALDVAKKAQVSVVTVSRAFNNSPMVTAATRDKVLAAARELGYRPNPVARALRQQRTNSLAIVMTAVHLTGPFYAEMLAGFHKVVHERELSVLLAVAPNLDELPTWLSHFVRGAAFDGLVLHHDIVRKVGVQTVLDYGVPLIIAGLIAQTGPPEKQLCCVGFDHPDAIQQATRYLIALGHKNLGYLDIPQRKRPSSREAKFRKELADAGLSICEDWIASTWSDDNPAAGTEAIHAILSRKGPHPTAVICGTDLIAAGAIEGAKSWGKRVPEDLSVIGYGDGPWASLMHPPLTTIHQRGWDLGVALAEKILAVCDDIPGSEDQNILPMPLVVRCTTAAPGSVPKSEA